MVIAFWPHMCDTKVASYRLRCQQIVQGLQARGISCGIYRASSVIPRILVLSKRYDKYSIDHGMLLRSRYGTKLVLDICDNHFYSNCESVAARKRSDILRHAVRSVDCVIASTHELAKIIVEEANQSLDIHVVGDAVELPFIPNSNEKLFHLGAELKYSMLKNQLKNSNNHKVGRLVWFGNHGFKNAEGGMGDLLRIRDVIEGLSDSVSLSLTVISNSKQKFRKLISGWSIPTHYLPWNRWNISRALALHDISIIPIGINPFTKCKTNNRVATSLIHGLAVVADSIPSYLVFKKSVELDNWKYGLNKYIQSPELRAEDIKKGVDIINDGFSHEKILKQWMKALGNIEGYKKLDTHT